MKIAGYEISTFVADIFRLDGGAMFGAVPKTLWSKNLPADENNRIPMCSRLLVLRKDSMCILIDLGCGDKWEDKYRKIYEIEATVPMPLNQFIPNVTHIILTHCHFDHVGGISYLDQSKNLQLVFPDAKVFVGDLHLQHALNPGKREQASYFKENLEPLKSCKGLTLTKDGQEILPGITVHQTNGHTKGMQWIKISDDKSTLAYVADVIPTAHHIPVPYVMGYDVWADKMMEEKELLLEQAAKGNWILVFEHDAHTAAGTIKCDERGRYSLAKAIDLPKYK